MPVADAHEPARRPRPDGRRGTLTLIAAASVGWLIAASQPFGTPPRGDGPSIMNGVVLALAPLVAAVVAYRPVRSVAWSPRGLASSTEIGSPVMLGAWLLTTPPVAIEFAWGPSRFGEAVIIWGLVNVSWLVTLEIQRRTRQPLHLQNRREDHALHLNVEALAVGGLWTLSALAAGELRLACFALAAGTTFAYVSATHRLTQRGEPRAWMVYPVWAGGFTAAGYGSLAVGCGGLLIASAVIVAMIEQPRRRTLRRDRAANAGAFS